MSYLYQNKDIQALIDLAEKRVCQAYRLSPDAIRRGTRNKESTQARFAVWFILNVIAGIPASVIGRIYDYDHSSIMNGCFRARELGIPEELGYEKILGTIPLQYVDKSGFSGDKKRGETGDKKSYQISSPSYKQSTPPKNIVAPREK